MSWTINDALKEDKAVLVVALENAKEKNIIMFCAARDEGKEEGGRPVYPYSTAVPGILICIGASDEYGKERSYVPEEIDYLLPGVGLAEYSVPIADSNKGQVNVGEGSSEAIALAAGVVALILFCFAIVDNISGIDEVRGPARMKELFNKFANGHNYSVLPGVFVATAEAAAPKDGNVLNKDRVIEKRMRILVDSCRGVIIAQKNKRAKAGLY